MPNNTQMKKTRIAALLTCFNRRSKTLDCLDSLYKQIETDQLSVEVYLVDDGSTDGTSEEVSKKYPDIKLLRGDGNLFWAGGMRKAFSSAMKDDPDFYLWLNDDTFLLPNALSILMNTLERRLEHDLENQPLIVGSTCDPDTHLTTYGGVNIKYKWWPLRYELVTPSPDFPVKCDTLNGNCVLIPRQLALKLGGIDKAFTHYLADHDFGLRARALGHETWIAPGHLGTCELSKTERKTTKRSDFSSQLEALDSPKGLSIGGTDLTSFREWKVYSKRHGGWLWPIYWVAPYRRLLFLKFNPFQRTGK